MIDETFKLETPENVQINYDVAGIGSRFMATLIDQLWLLLIRGLIFVIGLAVYFALDLSSEVGIIIASIGVMIFFILGWGYYIFFEINWNGQSPGKRQIGLRVVKTNGLPVSASEVVIRNLMRVVDVLPSSYGLGVVVMFFNNQARRLGDLAAGTMVIFEQTEVSLQEVKSRNRVSLGAIAVTERVSDMPIEMVSKSSHEMAESFLSRASHGGEISNSFMLADQILRKIYAEMDLLDEYSNLNNFGKIDLIRQLCVRLRQAEDVESQQ